MNTPAVSLVALPPICPRGIYTPFISNVRDKQTQGERMPQPGLARGITFFLSLAFGEGTVPVDR